MLTLLLKYKKLIGYATAVLTLVVTLYQLHDYIYKSGYQAAVNEITAEHNKALESQRKEYEKKIEESLERIQADHAQELERVRNEREIITKVETVTEYVDREIIVEAQCDALANHVISVLKQATSIVSDSSAAN